MSVVRMPVRLRLVQADDVERAPEDRPSEVVAIHRPRTRGECVDGPRPCPYVGCRHHLYVELDDPPSTDEDDPLAGLAETCSLDVAEHGGLTLAEIGGLIGVTRERIRQIEMGGLAHFARHTRRQRMGRDDFLGGEPADGDATLDELADVGGGMRAEPVETTTSIERDRGATLDADAVYCERIWTIYERASDGRSRVPPATDKGGAA